jgi:hypothetical protein
MHECTNAGTQECRNLRLRKWRSCIRALVHLCICALLMSGCTRARAKTEPDAPALNMPAPPPREVEVADATVPVPPPPPPAEEPARRAPAAAPARPRPAPPKQEPAPAPAVAATPAPVEPPKPAEEPPKPPATTLQTAPTGNAVEVERTIRTVLTRASADLNRIDYRALNADARTQYDTAKRFVIQAQEALRAKNLVFARNLADKAAALAAQLGGK